MTRSGNLKRHHPVGRMLDSLALLAGGFLLHVRGEDGDNFWRVMIPGQDRDIWVNIPISSSPDEARSMLAATVDLAHGR